MGKIIIVSLFLITSFLVRPYNETTEILFQSDNPKKIDNIIRMLLKPFIKWDSLYFADIAEKGYTFEKHFAFMPLYPLISRWLANLVPFQIEYRTKIAIGLVVTSNWFHLLACLTLFDLSILMFEDYQFSIITAALYCLNPGAVHLTAAYSESLCAFLSFIGFYCFYRKKYMLTAAVWGLASASRANAVTLSGFFLYNFVMHPSLLQVQNTLVYIALSMSGFALHLYSAFKKFCNSPNSFEWCQSQVPNIYSHVQKNYWNVGFLQYYSLNQIPNFLIAAPIILLSIHGISSYVTSDIKGFVTLRRAKPGQNKFFSPLLLPHVYLWLFMTLYVLLFAHVQIMTRLFTFLPIVYWYMAHLLIGGKFNIIPVIGCYSIISAVLFASFYPPA